MKQIQNAAVRQAFRLCCKSILLGGVSLMAAGAAHAQSTPQADAAASEDTRYDIVVTARRREENIQTVPVAVTALSSETLQERGIATTEDLQKLVPGVIFSGAGGSESPTFFIRGQGRDVIGQALPSVITYFNEVPLNARGSTIPTFDVANVQVLKGPQGTLFGRNTTGGAVLYYSQAPSYDFNGYAQVTLGDYSWHGLEAAVNAPLIADKLAVRVAGQYQKRDGYTKNMSGAQDQDNVNTRAFRISVLAEPVSGIKNTLVFDYFWTRYNATGIIALGSTGLPVYTFDAAAFGPFLGPIITANFNCSTSIDCNVNQQLARQAAAGPRRTWSDPGRTEQLCQSLGHNQYDRARTGQRQREEHLRLSRIAHSHRFQPGRLAGRVAAGQYSRQHQADQRRTADQRHGVRRQAELYLWRVLPEGQPRWGAGPTAGDLQPSRGA